MNPNTLAKLAVRIVAIYYFAQGLVYFPTLLSIPDAAQMVGGTDTTVYLYTLVTALPLVVGLLLWFAADPLSRLAIGQPEPGGSPATALQIQAVAISTAGLLLLFSAIPEFVRVFIHTVVQQPELASLRITEDAAAGYLVGSGLQVLFALALVVGAGFWPKLLWRIRDFGNPKESSNYALERTDEE